MSDFDSVCPQAGATGEVPMKPVVVGLIFLAAMVVLLWVGISSASIPVLKVGQLQSAAYQGGTVRVDDGKVASKMLTALKRFTPKGGTLRVSPIATGLPSSSNTSAVQAVRVPDRA